MTDETIVRLYWERSEDAIRETENAYGRYFHAIAYGILRDGEDAREVVNDTYLKAWNTIPPKRPSPLKAFLGRITRQLSLNRLEQETAQKRGGGQYRLALDELEECIPAKSGDGEWADRMALTGLLNRFLRSLPEEQRYVFIRRYWYLEPVSEIAAAAGAGESKVKSQLARMRAKLRRQLEKEGFAV